MLLTQIKKDRMQANKEGQKKKYETLTTLLSEIQRLDKIDQEDDKKVQAVCKKYIKGIDDLIKSILGVDHIEITCIEDSKELTEQSIEDIKATELLVEQIYVQYYLPKQLCEEELKRVIQYIIQEIDANSMKDMGKIMKSLKEKHDGQYDGKLASTIVRGFLVRL